MRNRKVHDENIPKLNEICNMVRSKAVLIGRLFVVEKKEFLRLERTVGNLGNKGF